MSMPLVLVHGALHGAWCWAPTVVLLDGPVLAVDLPPKTIRGRRPDGTAPAELGTLGVDDFAASVLADVDAAGYDEFVLVGHSMAGVTLPEVARRAPARVRHLVFVSAITPAEGTTLFDGLPAELQPMAQAAAEAGPGGNQAVADVIFASLFCNDLDEVTTRFVLDRLCLEAARPALEPVFRTGIDPAIPKTYVRLTQDAALVPTEQDRQIANLEASPGGTVQVVDIDAAHDVMISRPDALAAVLSGLVAVP